MALADLAVLTNAERGRELARSWHIRIFSLRITFIFFTSFSIDVPQLCSLLANFHLVFFLPSPSSSHQPRSDRQFWLVPQNHAHFSAALRVAALLNSCTRHNVYTCWMSISIRIKFFAVPTQCRRLDVQPQTPTRLPGGCVHLRS